MNLKNYTDSKQFQGILIGIIITVIAILIFQMGVNVGQRQSRFVRGFGDNFEQNFRNPKNGLMPPMFNEGQLPGGHGVFGQIVSISLPTIIVAGPDQLEKTVILESGTMIRKFQEEIQDNELVVGEHIVILGVPNESGQIKAKLIRILPQKFPDSRIDNNFN